MGSCLQSDTREARFVRTPKIWEPVQYGRPTSDHEVREGEGFPGTHRPPMAGHFTAGLTRWIKSPSTRADLRRWQEGFSCGRASVHTTNTSAERPAPCPATPGEDFPHAFKGGLRPPREPLRRPSAPCRFAPGAAGGGQRDNSGHAEAPDHPACEVRGASQYQSTDRLRVGRMRT
jgi:hypothetical protein